MSFYNHPYSQQHYPRRAHHASVFPGVPAPGPAFNFYTAPSPVPASAPTYANPFSFATHSAGPYHPSHQVDETDYEAEECAALAQLHAIQHRRRLAQAEAEVTRRERESQLRREAEIKARRDAEIRAFIEREVQQVREREVQKARERELHQVREHRERALVEQHRQRVLALAHAQAEREREMARRQAYLAEVQRVKQEKYRQWTEARRGCAGRRAERKEEDNGVQDLHRFMRMLGINLGPEVDGQEENKVEEKQTKVEEKKVEVPAPVTHSAEATGNSTALPDNLNTLLDHFLGLKLQPVSQDAPTSQIPTDNKVPQGLNEFLSRFGLEFEPLDIERETTEKKGEEKVAEPKNQAKVVDKKVENKKVEQPAPLASTTTTTPAAGTSTSTSAERSSNEYDLNNFLSRFGCQIDNSTFNQFFDPSKNDHPDTTPCASTSASHPAQSSTHQPTETPLTSYLNQVADIPPFVRDILSNVELAFKESHKDPSESASKAEETYKGKGKGVAHGEKAATTPTSTSTSTKSTSSNSTSTPVTKTKATSTQATQPGQTESTPLTKLDSIAHDLYLTTASFTFPQNLSFSKPSTTKPSPTVNDTEYPSSTPTQTQTPQLLFNKTNSSYHAQAHKLLQLLLEADGIVSGGDSEVRRKRKEVVRRVEGEIEELERRRDEVWRERVQRGEIGEGEEEEEVGSERSSRGGSVIGEGEVEGVGEVAEVEHIEHSEGVEGYEVKPVEVKVTTDTPGQTSEIADHTSTTVDELAKVDDEKDESSAADDHREVRGENVEDRPTAEEDVKQSQPFEEDKKSVTVEDVTDKEEGYELL